MNIDWTQVITQAMKDQAMASQQLAEAIAATAKRRALADAAITPLQDAIDINNATEADHELLNAWKKYRVALRRLPEQKGYPTTIEWPIAPSQSVGS